MCACVRACVRAFLFAVEKTCHICDVACSAHLAVALQEEKLNERVKMKNREEEKKESDEGPPWFIYQKQVCGRLLTAVRRCCVCVCVCWGWFADRATPSQRSQALMIIN